MKTRVSLKYFLTDCSLHLRHVWKTSDSYLAGITPFFLKKSLREWTSYPCNHQKCISNYRSIWCTLLKILNVINSLNIFFNKAITFFSILHNRWMLLYSICFLLSISLSSCNCGWVNSNHSKIVSVAIVLLLWLVKMGIINLLE